MIEVVQYPYDRMKKLQEFHVALHQAFYSNTSDLIITFLRFLEATDIFVAEFDSVNRSIKLRVKITNAKRLPNFSHNTEYYSPIIMNAYLSAINMHRLELNVIDSLGIVNDIMMIPNLANSLLSITTLVHNIVIIRL